MSIVSRLFDGAVGLFQTTRRNVGELLKKTHKRMGSYWRPAIQKTAAMNDPTKQQIRHESSVTIHKFMNEPKTKLHYEETDSKNFFESRPKRVLLIVTGHGALISPKRVPLEVERHLAADFESSNFKTRVEKEKINLAAHLGKEDVLKSYIIFRSKQKVEPHLQAYYDQFVKDRHYMTVRDFKPGAYMFDKEFEIRVRVSDKDNAADKIVLTDPDTKRTVNLANFLNPDEQPNVYKLSSILAMLHSNGVTKVDLYDFSCNNGYTPLLFWRQAHYYKHYGGRSRRLRKRR